MKFASLSPLLPDPTDLGPIVEWTTVYVMSRKPSHSTHCVQEKVIFTFPLFLSTRHPNRRMSAKVLIRTAESTQPRTELGVGVTPLLAWINGAMGSPVCPVALLDPTGRMATCPLGGTHFIVGAKLDS